MAKENPDGQEKTEDPTEKRISKARSEGQVSKSMEINLVAGLLAATCYFAVNGSAMIKDIRFMLERLLSDLSMDLTQVAAVKIGREVINNILVIITPFILILVAVSILANVFQTGFLFTATPLKPKFDKFNVIKGIKNKLSMKNFVNIIKAVVKIAVIGVVPFIIVKAEVVHLPLIMDMGVWSIMCYMGSIIIKIVFYISMALIILAILDFIYEKRKHKQQMMMTKQEVKDEHKQSEGDPKIKARIRQLQFKMILKRMMDDVPKAEVVVTNPVHVAVALRYDRLSMDAPKVVAKGARLIAKKIKEIALQNNVPVVENKPLAQSLFKTVEVGDLIPDALYKAVAEILAYVYSRKNKTASGY